MTEMSGFIIVVAWIVGVAGIVALVLGAAGLVEVSEKHNPKLLGVSLLSIIAGCVLLSSLGALNVAIHESRIHVASGEIVCNLDKYSLWVCYPAEK